MFKCLLYMQKIHPLDSIMLACEFCKTMVSAKFMAKHRQMCKRNPHNKRKYLCKTCKKMLSSMRNLKIHSNSHRTHDVACQTTLRVDAATQYDPLMGLQGK